MEKNNSKKRVVLVQNTSIYVGPALARELARQGNDLVIGDPADGLVEELKKLGAQVEAVKGVSNLEDRESTQKLIDAGIKRFGKIDAATCFSGEIVTATFMDSTNEQLQFLMGGIMVSSFNFLQIVATYFKSIQSGQILLITSATAVKPSRLNALYSACRAGTNMMVRSLASEVAGEGVQVNSIGSNYMNFKEFDDKLGTDDREIRFEYYEQVPMHKFGTMEGFANACMVFLDGRSRFSTGQYFAYDGGWSAQ